MSRKLDALFAERVLGLDVDADGLMHGLDEDGYESCCPVKPYTTSLDAAWQGVEKCGFMELRGHRGPFRAIIRGEGSVLLGTAERDHPAHAIVLACLRACNVSEQEIQEASNG